MPLYIYFVSLKINWAKIIKIGVRTLLILLLLMGGLTLLVRNDSFQTYIAQKVAEKLSSDIGCEIKVDRVAIDFSRNIQIQGIYLGDQKKDTLISIANFTTKLLNWNIERQVVYLGESVAADGKMHIGLYKDSNDLNIDFLLEYFKPKKKNKVKSDPWKIHFEDAELSNIEFYYFDDNKIRKPAGQFDETHLLFTELNGHARDFWLIDDSLHFIATNLKAKEKSGLVIDELDAICNIHYHGMDFTELRVKTPCSTIGDELHFTYPSYKVLGDFISVAQWKGRVRKTEICLKELSIFDPFFENNVEKINISAAITGTVDHLVANNVNAQLGKSTIQGDLKFDGLPAWRTSNQEFTNLAIKTNGADISALMNEAMPETLFKLGEISYEGTFSGKFLDFELNGNCETNQGNVALTAFNLNVENGVDNGTFGGIIKTEAFNIADLAPESKIGTIAINGLIEGKNLNENIEIYTKSAIDKIEYNGFVYKNISIDGTASALAFNGKINSEDETIPAKFDGLLEYGKPNGKLAFETKINRLPLKQFNLEQIGDFITADAVLDVEGTNIKELKGTMRLRDVLLVKNGKTHTYDLINISKIPIIRGGSHVEIDGDFVNGTIDGNVDITKLQDVVMNNLHEIFPMKFSAVPTPPQSNFNFDIHVKKPDYLLSFIDKDIKTDPIKLKGTFADDKGLLFLQLLPLNLIYKDYSAQNVSCEINKRNQFQMEYGFTGFNLSKAGNKVLNYFELIGDAENNSTELSAKAIDATGKNSAIVAGLATVFKDSVPMILNETTLKIDQNEWKLFEQSNLYYASNKLVIDDLFLEGKDNYLELSGTIGEKMTDKATLDFGNLSSLLLEPFVPGNTLANSKFKLSGTLNLKSILGTPIIGGETYIKGFSYKETNYGDLSLSFNDINRNTDLIDLSLRGSNGYFSGIEATGILAPKSEVKQFDFDLNVKPNTSILALQPILKDIVTINYGTIEGKAKLKGTAQKPQMSGIFNLNSTSIKVDYLNTNYSFAGEFFLNNNGIYSSNKIAITDEDGKGTARAELALTHNNFDNWGINLLIDQANNLKALNTSKGQNDLFFGKGYADGYCRIFGPFDAVNMDIKLKTRENSIIYLPYSSTEINNKAGFVTFVNKNQNNNVNQNNEKSSINNINLEIEATPNAEVLFVIDEKLGDVIKGRGTGLLRMLYDENQNFYLNGTYTIENGDYAFSLPGINLVTRKITLDKGGQITWTGDPFDAQLNLTGSFTKKLSPAVLMPPNSGSYPAITVISKLFLKGALFKPDISFDLESPDINNTASTNTLLASTFARIRSDEDERLRQAVWLLLFGSFVPPSNLVASNGAVSNISGLAVAGNSLGALVSSQANTIFSQFGLPTQFQFNFDNVGNTGANTTSTQVFINSETQLSQRFKLNVNYDNTLRTSLNSGINFNLEYAPENSQWRMRIFSRNQNQLNAISYNNNTIQNVSGYTLGTGVIFQLDFDSFKKYK